MEYGDIAFELKEERKSKEISPLSITFFEDAKRYLQELEEEIEKCNNSRSRESMMLSDELNTSLGRIEEIFYLRKSKIFQMAAQTRAVQHKNCNRLLPEEKRMYNSLIQSGESLKKEVLDTVIFPDEELNQVQEEDKRMLVRILKDIPTFVGVDGNNYTVKAEDTLMMPLINAQALIKKNIAQSVNNQL